jgi:hypothetical protein
MFHTPTMETKRKNTQAGLNSPQPMERERSPLAGAFEYPRQTNSTGEFVVNNAVQRNPQLAGLHGTYGNQAVLRMLDRSSRPPVAGSLQRKCACGGSGGTDCPECQKDKEQTLQRAAAKPAEAGIAPPIVHEVVRSPGHPLGRSTRDSLEPAFGRSFGQVRLHTDPKAAESARAVSALAYTVGHHVVFGDGQYRPHTEQGRHLIAHELTHTIQQESAAHGVLNGADFKIGQANDSYEQEAERQATQALRGQRRPQPIAQSRTGVARLQRQDAGSPDAGQQQPDAGQQQPDAGQQQPGPQQPAPQQPAVPAPAAAPPVVTDLTVVNQQTAIAYEEPGPGGPHFVTVAGQTGDENVIVEATLDRPLNAGETLPWVISPASGGSVDPANPARVLVSRRHATQVQVALTTGGASRSLIVWAIFAQVRIVNGPALGFSPPAAPPPGSACAAGAFCVFATVNFDAEIFPRSLVTAANRPSFARPPVAPPGAANSCGAALAGGVGGRFDMSRQINVTNVDPAGHLAAACVFTPRAFPANNAEGNDDARFADEKDDPFAAGAIPMNGRAVAAGFIGSYDPPSLNIPQPLGAVGDSIEASLTYREFARLEYHQTWWLVSNRQPWFATFRVQKNAAGLWVDNGSAAG